MPAVAAFAALVGFGYIPGSLLVPAPGSIAWIVIRPVIGLLLTSVAFLGCLATGLPWWLGPVALAAFALLRRRWDAVRIPRQTLALHISAAPTAILVAVLTAPILVSAARMTPGPHPPVFFSVDNAYFLEQVHSLARAETYPPPSLSNLGGGRTYHYAVHGMAAFLSRVSGLRPHHALYAVIVPLLAMGIVAGAVAAARALAPAMPAWIAVPLLLIGVPTFWYPFWGEILSIARQAPAGVALAALLERREMWAIVTTEGQNLGGSFVVLVALAALASGVGWALPVVLIGTAIIVKTSTGVALAAGFVLAQAYRALRAQDLSPLWPAAATVAIGAATYTIFWIVPAIPPDFSTELAPLFHISRMRERDAIPGLALDLAWLLLPVAIVALARARAISRPPLPLLCFALTPFVVVNTTQAVDARPGGGGATDDWLQILSPSVTMLHAYALAFASARWAGLVAGARTAVLVILALAVVPVAVVAGNYVRILVQAPERGHEFADNRAIGEALAAIPVDGSVIVTNDLRYPADNFNRDDRQMQIPALFGHQAFAVNYRYEAFPFSNERRRLQGLLTSPSWTPEILDAARTHGWTHFLVHAPYAHPSQIPIPLLFQNERYAVYRFPR